MINLALSNQDIAIILLLVCVIPVLILMVVAIIVAIRKNIKQSKQRFENVEEQEIDLEQKKLFIEAFGGDDNILEVSKDMSRLNVKVLNIDKVRSEEIKSLGATGVLLVGDTVKASFGDRISYVYKIMEKN